MVAIKPIITTTSLNVACVFPQDTSYLAPCDHEEADTRISYIWQAQSKRASKKSLLCTMDTNLVVLSVAAATKYVYKNCG